MATILRDKGMDVSILDQPAKGYTIEDTVRWVKKENPDLLGRARRPSVDHMMLTP
jgi:hypothetical protein